MSMYWVGVVWSGAESVIGSIGKINVKFVYRADVSVCRCVGVCKLDV